MITSITSSPKWKIKSEHYAIIIRKPPFRCTYLSILDAASFKDKNPAEARFN